MSCTSFVKFFEMLIFVKNFLQVFHVFDAIVNDIIFKIILFWHF